MNTQENMKQPMRNIPLMLGALLSLSSVVLGAVIRHTFSDASAQTLNSLSVALEYQRWHALVLVVLGVALYAPLERGLAQSLRRLSWGFVFAIVCFSGSIYVAMWLEMPALTRLTPIGGIAFMLSWLLLAVVAWRYRAPH